MVKGERDLALDSTILDNFKTAITDIGEQQVYGLPDFTEYVNHTGKYTRPSLRLASGIFISNMLPADSSGAQRLKPTAFSFNVQPGHRLGREKSHNEVFFGKLISSRADTSSTARESHVAVKPTKTREAMIGELAMFQYLIKLGIPTFEPTAILSSSVKKQDYLLTKFEKPVATMDTVEWKELDVDEKWLQLDFAVKTMALLHSKLLFHGDLEFKNVGFGERGDLIVVDPELTVSSLEMAQTAAEQDGFEAGRLAQIRIKQSMSTDFTSVCTSIEEFIIGSMPSAKKPHNPAARFKNYARHLFRPYREALIDSGSDFLPQLLAAYETVFQEHKQRSRQ